MIHWFLLDELEQWVPLLSWLDVLLCSSMDWWSSRDKYNCSLKFDRELSVYNIDFSLDHFESQLNNPRQTIERTYGNRSDEIHYLKIRICVGITMSEIVRIIIVRKFACPRQRIQIRRWIIRTTKRFPRHLRVFENNIDPLRKIISIIDDFFSPSSPS